MSGHDEDATKASKGTPLERVLAMAKAMIDVTSRMTAPNGDRIRVGRL